MEGRVGESQLPAWVVGRWWAAADRVELREKLPELWETMQAYQQ